MNKGTSGSKDRRSTTTPTAEVDVNAVDKSLRHLKGEIALASIMNDDIDDDKLDGKSVGDIDSDDSTEPDRCVSPLKEADAVATVVLQSSKFMDSSVMFAASLSLGRTQTTPDHLKQPWEKGIFSQVFGDPLHLPWLKNRVLSASGYRMPDMSVNKQVNNSEAISRQAPVFSSAVFRIKRPKLRVTPPSAEVMRSRAIAKWRCIVEADLYKTSLGRKLVDFVVDGNSEALIEQIFEDTFSEKATETLLKRSQSLSSYMAFCRQQFLVYHLHFSESAIYQYLDSLRSSNAAASRGKSFLEALTFALHTVGPDIGDADWLSPRVKGVANKMHCQKRPLDQAPPLYVWEVKLLHSILSNADIMHDKVVAGYMLFLIYACARWSDAQFPTSVENDVHGGVGYFEMKTCHHKTAQGARRNILMPLVATSPGLGKINGKREGWVEEWLKARKFGNLDFQPGKPTMPSILSDGSWSSSAMSASEGSAYLRELIQGYAPSKPKRSKQLRSHSLKSTMLSYCAKKPLPKEYRRALGHHVDSKDASIVTYSRDYLFAPLLALDKLLEEIVSGKFAPDESRAERVVRLKAASSVRASERASSSVPSRVDKVADDDDESRSGSSDGEESEASIPDADIDDAAMAEIRKGKDCLTMKPDQKELVFFWHHGKPLTTYQHNNSGVLHCLKPGEANKLGCSRVVSRVFTKIDVGLNFKWPRCAVCAKAYGTQLLPKAKSQP